MNATMLHCLHRGGCGGFGGFVASRSGPRGSSSGPAVGGVRGDAGWVGDATADPVSREGDDCVAAEVGAARYRVLYEYPWQWQCADVEAFIDSCRNKATPIVVSTARLYETTLRMFLDYLTDARYGWPAECMARFGITPSQVLHEWNTVVHVSEYEGDPRRRPLTYDEVQAMFDAADGHVDAIRTRHRKGGLAAMRDAALLRTIYAFGLRRQEAWGLDLSDLRHNPKMAAFGRFGALFVRWGKSSRGSRPKRRTVLTVPEMDWIVPILQQ
jgi:integrase